MLAPTILVSGPRPRVGINLDAPFGFVVILVFDMPAIAFRVANDGSRGVRRREGENAERTRNGELDTFSWSSSPSSVVRLERFGRLFVSRLPISHAAQSSVA